MQGHFSLQHIHMHDKQTCITSGKGKQTEERKSCSTEGRVRRGVGSDRGACSCITCMTRLLSEVAVIMHDKSALISTKAISACKCDDGRADWPLAFSLLRCRGHQTRRACTAMRSRGGGHQTRSLGASMNAMMRKALDEESTHNVMTTAMRRAPDKEGTTMNATMRRAPTKESTPCNEITIMRAPEEEGVDMSAPMRRASEETGTTIKALTRRAPDEEGSSIKSR